MFSILIIIGLILAFIGTTAVVILIIRAVPRLPPPTTPLIASRESALKDRIILERITRRIRERSDAIIRSAGAASRRTAARFHQGYRALRLRAQEYAAAPGAPSSSCAELATEAAVSFDRGEYDLSEEKYLACLKKDAKYRDAYIGLSVLYRARNESGLAEETLRFLKKLYPDDAEVAYLLAAVSRERGKDADALRAVEAALETEPRNPKYLDFATDLAIVRRRARLASQFLARLREANPENQKLAEFEERIATIEK